MGTWIALAWPRNAVSVESHFGSWVSTPSRASSASACSTRRQDEWTQPAGRHRYRCAVPPAEGSRAPLRPPTPNASGGGPLSSPAAGRGLSCACSIVSPAAVGMNDTDPDTWRQELRNTAPWGCLSRNPVSVAMKSKQASVLRCWGSLGDEAQPAGACDPNRSGSLRGCPSREPCCGAV